MHRSGVLTACALFATTTLFAQPSHELTIVSSRAEDQTPAQPPAGQPPAGQPPPGQGRGDGRGGDGRGQAAGQGRGASGGGFRGPAQLPFDTHEGFKQIFDGRSLKDWDGDPAFWKVEAGAIVGQSTP